MNERWLVTGAAGFIGSHFVEWALARTPEELHPEPLLGAEDLRREEVPRGPLWGELLREAEEAQLDQLFDNHTDAAAWLRKRAAECRQLPSSE